MYCNEVHCNTYFDQENLDCQGKRYAWVLEFASMTAKDTSLNLRIRSELKKRLESAAASEGRSVAQICEAFLQAGLATYEKEGAKYISRFLAVHQPSASDRTKERT
jgi:hypothetical protein